MADLPSDIDRINALTTNARNTWFALLGVLVFVSITLMGVEHIDFYGVDRATELPLIGVEVPTRFFFIAAPLLTAAIYGYFHLYLIRLWDALSLAPARIFDKPLGDVISPWLVSDAALHIRAVLRRDRCTTPRTLESGAMLLNFLLAWIFGIVVLGWLWWSGMTARLWWMTSFSGLAFALSIFTGCASFSLLILRSKQLNGMTKQSIFSSVPSMSGTLVLVPLIIYLSLNRTIGSIENLAPIRIVDGAVVEKPSDWLPHHISLREFIFAWCKREDVKDCQREIRESPRFFAEWNTRRESALRSLRKPFWLTEKATNPADLSNAFLPRAFLVGSFLYEAKISGANLWRADLEGAILAGADLTDTSLVEANLTNADMEAVIAEGAQFDLAVLDEASFRNANLERSSFTGALARNVNFDQVDFNEADLGGVDFTGSTLANSSLQNSNLSGASLINTNLWGALIENSYLLDANLKDSNLTTTSIFGTEMSKIDLRKSNFEGVNFSFGALQHVNLASITWNLHTDLRDVFLDGSVNLPTEFKGLMGEPCQWLVEPVPLDTFLSLWRWWVEKHPYHKHSIPKRLHSAPPPTPELLAKYNLTDCEPQRGPFPTGK